ncbi:radical SAM protein [Telmatospirillum siberiense]|uniref:radical SAM protein n=1 Tax=Telmatospirillum siberiense TaxID=382514 RepID=UPI0013047BC1|nr:radical SAM protein [Telmatospirillum siberiense]
MTAIDISGHAPGGTRRRLADSLPLKTPFVVQVFPVYACNLKCNYCIFSVDKSLHGFISDKTLLDYDLYRKCVDDMSGFPEKIKVLRFVGIGEPLIHKKLVDMIRYTAERRIANTIEIVSNAVLLTPTMSDALLEAGLNRLVVSVQGTSADKYWQESRTRIDFERFVDNLAYFYRNKGKAHLYVKIVDTALDDDADRQRFHDIFGKVCDTIAVENTVPIHDSVNYDDILGDREKRLTQYGLPVTDVKVCPQPFFHMQINPDGKIVPCYSWDYPAIMGDCREQSMVEIWNSETFRKFRLSQLHGCDQASHACKNCNIIKYRLFPEDDLRNDVERLMPFYL